MAGIPFTADTTSVALTASQTHTLGQVVAATNTRVKVSRIDVTVDGVTAADPQITIDVLTQSSAGTMSAVTPVKLRSSDSETLQTTAQKNASGTEPTTVGIIGTYFCHPMYGMPPIIYDPPIEVVGGTRLGVRATPGTLTATTHVSTVFTCEE